MTELCRALGRARRLGAAALRLSVPARRRSDSADGRRQDPALPRRAVPARAARASCRLMKRPASGEKMLERIRAWRAICPDITHPQHLHRRLSRRDRSRVRAAARSSCEEAQLDRVGCFAYSPVEGAAANALPDPVPEEVKEERRARFMDDAGGDQFDQAASAGSARRLKVLVDEPGVGRSQRRRAGDRRRGAFRGRKERASSRRFSSIVRTSTISTGDCNEQSRSSGDCRRAHGDRRLRRRAEGHRADEARRDRDQGGRGAREGRPGERRPCRDGQRHPRRGEGHVSLARRRGRGRHAGGHAGPHGEPPVRLGPAGDRLGARSTSCSATATSPWRAAPRA